MTTSIVSYSHPDHTETVFHSDGRRIWLRRLFGLLCGYNGEDTGPLRTQGLVSLSTSLGRLEGEALELAEVQPGEDDLFIAWQMAGNALRLESHWSFAMGVISRWDRLINTGGEPVTIYRMLARFPLSMASPEVYSQGSVWCRENQGHWTFLHTGRLVLSNQRGRTALGGTPFACLREAGSHQGLAFHLRPVGNWTIQVHAFAIQQSTPYALVELGQADDGLRLALGPGEVFQAPEILIQALPEGKPHLAAPGLHAYYHMRGGGAPGAPPGKPEPPLVYNTWFFQFDRLDVPALRQQLAAAKEIGCEVFVIDAGWFGPQGPGWWNQAGDWREKTEAAFHGAMSGFAEEVLAAGLGFGLWMEPERFAVGVPVRQAHPEWFLPAQGELARIDLENPDAYRYLRREIGRLVEAYRLAWMKIDSNFELGDDPTGAELSGYYTRWFQLLNEIRLAYPETFFEGCASGGMRLELNMLAHFDAHFLSDTVNPVDTLRILQGALLRLPPGRLTHWAVLRSAGNQIPWYSDPMNASWPDTIVTPQGAGWQPSETVDVDFALLAALPGGFGLSGDLASLPREARQRLAWAAGFYKGWRRLITGAVAHLLTPPKPIADRAGWAAFQLQDPHDTTSLLFTYRLDDWRSLQIFPLCALEPKATYLVRREDIPGQPEITAAGQELMSRGLEISLPSPNRAAVYSIKIS